jgi:hypothetical protein
MLVTLLADAISILSKIVRYLFAKLLFSKDSQSSSGSMDRWMSVSAR